MTAIAIDYWDKRCWIALEIEKISVPKEIILRIDIIKTLEKYFKNYPEIDKIIVWLPYDLYWIEIKQLEKTKEFIRELENKFWKNSNKYKKYDIIWIDERFTSFEAWNVLDKFWENEKKAKLDAISASLILESYLNREKK